MIFSANTVILILCLSMARTCTSKNKCKSGWTWSPPSGTCIKIFHRKLSFWKAADTCIVHRGNILYILNGNMNNFVADHIKSERDEFFIGFTDIQTENVYKWIGSDITPHYSNWNSGEPNGGRRENCARIVSGSKKWIDYTCEIPLKFLCEVCPFGSYGSGCKHKCSTKCISSSNPCDAKNGNCFGGCVAGYRGDKCDTECLSGTFGSACSQQCNESCGGAGNPCHHIHGKCSENCDIGMFGAFCESTCSNGTFGFACSQQCNEHCGGAGNPCHHIGGECSENCDLGFIGAFCGSICPNGTFGHKCSRQCNEHCGGTGNLCDHQYGMCINDCDIGFQGVQCESMCSNNTYGNNCTKNCSVLCNEQACDPVTGACSSGCVAGYTGDKCVQKVIEGGRLPRWFPIVLILGGTVGGVIFALCLSRLSKKESEPHEEESHLYEDGEDPLPDFDDDYEDEIAQYYYDDVEYDEYDDNYDLDLDYFDDGFFDDNIDNYGEIVTQV